MTRCCGGSPVDDASYEAGRRDGVSSLTADISVQFWDAADTMDDLLGFFRRITGHPELDWPEDRVDWRAMFLKYVGIVDACEGVTFLYPPSAATPGAEDWTPGEWAAITALPGMERPA
jgi:hypothetical protein